MERAIKTPSTLPDGIWQVLLQHAFSLVDEIAAHGIQDPFWTFGGGTVLMLRYGHRLSKDIDIFVPDPQYLGYVSTHQLSGPSEIAGAHAGIGAYPRRPRGRLQGQGKLPPRWCALMRCAGKGQTWVTRLLTDSSVWVQ